MTFVTSNTPIIGQIFPAAKAAKDGWTMELDFPEEA